MRVAPVLRMQRRGTCEYEGSFGNREEKRHFLLLGKIRHEQGGERSGEKSVERSARRRRVGTGLADNGTGAVACCWPQRKEEFWMANSNRNSYSGVDLKKEAN